MSQRSFWNRSLEIDFTTITPFLGPRPLEQFLTDRGLDPDGVCVRLQMRCSNDDDVVLKRKGGARGYDIDGYWAMGDAEIDASVHDNKLHEATVALRVLFGRLVLERPPEKIIWAPGLYRPSVEHKAAGFGLRPLLVKELLLGASPTILELASASHLHTNGTPTGLYCLDAAEEPRLWEIALRLLDGAAVRHVSYLDEIEHLPRVCLPWVSELLKVLRDEPRPRASCPPTCEGAGIA
jgi:hypothetical protein